MKPQVLRIQYQDNLSRAERLRETVVQQFSELLNTKGLTLGVPMESRVKTWNSIEEKLERKSLEIESIFALQDLIGVRAIFLFRSDLIHALNLIEQNFDIISREDTATRLSESEFGYQSQHFIVKIPKKWLSLPSLANLGEFFVELQARTLAQHIWAAASHKLQYKQEAGVPPPLRRSINRVSALLETVDLEFERVLEERQRYVEETALTPQDREPLNIETLTSILNEILPPENKKAVEPYADLLSDLTNLGINTSEKLHKLISENIAAAIERDKELVLEHREMGRSEEEPEVIERVARGVFFAHVGLVREALRIQLGEVANEVFRARGTKKPSKHRDQSIKK